MAKNDVSIVGNVWPACMFLLDTACISKKNFVSNAGMCFEGIVVAIDKVLRSLKWKMLLKISQSWVENFPSCELKY